MIKDIFDRNGYPFNVVNFCIEKSLTKIHRPKVEVCTILKREINILLPFLGITNQC